MNFFEHQDRARHNTAQLLGMFGLAIACTIGGLYLAIAAGIAQGTETANFWYPQVLLWVALGTLLLVMGGSTSKYLALKRGGGSQVALSLGGDRGLAGDNGRATAGVAERSGGNGDRLRRTGTQGICIGRGVWH